MHLLRNFIDVFTSPCRTCCTTMDGSTYKLSKRAGSHLSNQGTRSSNASIAQPYDALAGCTMPLENVGVLAASDATVLSATWRSLPKAANVRACAAKPTVSRTSHRASR